MSTTENSSRIGSDPAPLRLDGGGCDCGCCGPTEPQTTLSREEEIAELRRLREQTERRLAEIDAESSS